MERNVQSELNSSEGNSIHKKGDVKVIAKKKQFHKIMGILNITPDSFYDGHQYFSLELALQKFQKLIHEGADIIDIGAVSSRPFAEFVSYEEERKRLIPLLKAIKSSPVPISIDTTDPKIAQEALTLGASLINDIHGFQDKELRAVVKEHQVPICVMHMQGNPQTMQVNPQYSEGIMSALLLFFEKRLEILVKEGIKLSNIIIDPGIGFGKTVEDCGAIIKNLSQLKVFGCPILIGLSRKSFMTKILKKDATQLLSTTIALNTICMREGAEIIRVHDVQAHRDVVDLLATGMFC